ncbi:hypothetical protein [Ralstonia phage RP31]|uniref:Transmembrane protein n=2 Tax=Ripduovirus RP12 TaxID=2560700 RepID=A0A1L7N0R7_9CAUD|nr:hypothetical protein FDH28_gp083 [Ralstonia phage RP12]BAW19057.1 hypothetical protein [Ralstonia phage RP12]BAW19342.1 hypothetical protein [Ralstonia phage RP31]
MSAEENKPDVLPVTHATTAAEAAVEEALEERREARSLKTWLVKAFTLTFIFVFGSSVMALIYAAVVKEKDLNTTFVGEMLKATFDFMRFVLSS